MRVKNMFCSLSKSCLSPQKCPLIFRPPTEINRVRRPKLPIATLLKIKVVQLHRRVKCVLLQPANKWDKSWLFSMSSRYFCTRILSWTFVSAKCELWFIYRAEIGTRLSIQKCNHLATLVLHTSKQ